MALDSIKRRLLFANYAASFRPEQVHRQRFQLVKGDVVRMAAEVAQPAVKSIVQSRNASESAIQGKVEKLAGLVAESADKGVRMPQDFDRERLEVLLECD